jgi:hypothetical protein
MKSAGFARTPEEFLRVAKIGKLPDRDDAVLFARQSGQLMVTSPFGVHTDY